MICCMQWSLVGFLTGDSMASGFVLHLADDFSYLIFFFFIAAF